MFKRIALLLAGTCAAVALAAGSAAASTGRVYYSPEQAGYAATGAHFKVVEVNVKLPDAGRFAREIGRLRLSVQLWTADTVVDLSVSACTDSSCRPGGSPVTRKYRLAFRVFSRSTGALICSTSNSTCPRVPSSWNRARVAPSHTARLSLFYDHRTGFLDAQVNDHDYLNYSPGPGIVFNQARIGAEFGATPWSTTPFRAPAVETRLATFGVPANEAEIVTYSGHASGLISWWAHHRVKMTSDGTSAKAVEARPHGLSNFGRDFSVYLEP